MSTLAIAPVPVHPLPLPAVPAAPASPASHAKRISLADRVARAFPPFACLRGFRSFTNDRVEILTATDVALDAVVKSKRTQTVRLRIGEGRLSAGCTCCAKLMGPAACRHVWATLLEVDRRGLFENMRSTPRALVLGSLEAAAAKPAKPNVDKAKKPAAAVKAPPASSAAPREKASARGRAAAKSSGRVRGKS